MINDPQPVKPVKGLDDKKIVSVTCGTNHSHCLTDDGNIYSWGFAAYGRLGLNHSPPKDMFIPTLVSGFTDRQNPAKKVVAGPSCAMVIGNLFTLFIV